MSIEKISLGKPTQSAETNEVEESAEEPVSPKKRDFSEVVEMFEKARGGNNFQELTKDINFMLNHWNDDFSKSLRAEHYPNWKREDFKNLLDELGEEFEENESATEAAKATKFIEDIAALEKVRKELEEKRTPEEKAKILEDQIKEAGRQLENTLRGAPKTMTAEDGSMKKISYYEYESVMNGEIEKTKREIAAYEAQIAEQQKIIDTAKGLFKGGKIKRAEEEIAGYKKQIEGKERYIKNQQSRLKTAREAYEKTGVAEQVEGKMRELTEQIEQLKKRRAEITA